MYFSTHHQGKYKFKVDELNSDWQTFCIPHSTEKTIYDIVQEAARLFYFGLGGWQESWPLTFTIKDLNETLVTKSSVFILSTDSIKLEWDIIPLSNKY